MPVITIFLVGTDLVGLDRLGGGVLKVPASVRMLAAINCANVSSTKAKSPGFLLASYIKNAPLSDIGYF